MKLFQGLYPYEAVLLVLGTVLFAALMFAFIWYIVKGKSIVTLLPFFLLPVIMIAYPSIESIKYEKGKLEFSKLLQEVDANPSNLASRRQMAKLYARLQQSYNTSGDPALLTSFAEAQYVLGNYEEAAAMANRAVRLQPDNQRIQQVQQKINDQALAAEVFKRKIRRLDTHIRSFESGDAGDPTGLNGVVRVLEDIHPPANIDNESAITLAKALAIAGKKESAIEMTRRVTASAKDTVRAANLRETIRQDRYTAASPRLEPEQQSRLSSNPAISRESISKLNLRTRVWADTSRVN